MTAAQRLAQRLLRTEERLDRVGRALLGSMSEVGRIECPTCCQRSLSVELFNSSVLVTCSSPALVPTEGNGGHCEFRHIVYSVSDAQLPALALPKSSRVVAPKAPARRTKAR